MGNGNSATHGFWFIKGKINSFPEDLCMNFCYLMFLGPGSDYRPMPPTFDIAGYLDTIYVWG